MSVDESMTARAPLAASVLSLFASSGTLVCCALPALLVALGAGAALSSLVAAFPAIVWVSEYKGIVFSVAGLMLGVGGMAQWRARVAPCPIDPTLRRVCLRTRRASALLYCFSVGLFAIGGWFAFVQPLLS
jgi:hypothetical protein